MRSQVVQFRTDEDAVVLKFDRNRGDQRVGVNYNGNENEQRQDI
jgi:hypothetical protein